MTKLALYLAVGLVAGGLVFCTREDGLPDPPPQQLVPCHPDGGSDDPLACPPAPDGLPDLAVDAQPGD